MSKEDYMLEAIKQAKIALKKGDVPIGAIIVKNNKIVAYGYNSREKKQNAICHAEINAINKACKKLKSWRLNDCEMYVTLEPCLMCMGAILNSRIKKLYFGAFDNSEDKSNSCEEICSKSILNHKLEIEGGILSEPCENLIKDFFKKTREKH